MANVQYIAAELLSIPLSDFLFLLRLELVSSYGFSSFNVLFRQLLCGLEPQLLRTFLAHLSNRINEALLPSSIEEVLQMETARAERNKVWCSLSKI